VTALNTVKSLVSIEYGGEGLHARNFLRLTMAKTILKNDNTKTKRKLKRKYFQKREINENENRIENEINTVARSGDQEGPIAKSCPTCLTDDELQ
jgi:hypothetical protein